MISFFERNFAREDKTQIGVGKMTMANFPLCLFLEIYPQKMKDFSHKKLIESF